MTSLPKLMFLRATLEDLKVVLKYDEEFRNDVFYGAV